MNRYGALIRSLSLILLLLLARASAQEKSEEKRPTQQELAGAIGLADRLVVTEPLRDEAIFELSAEGIGREFLTQFKIDETAADFHCMCYGEAWISFYRAGQKQAMLGFHHARSIRWIDGQWRSDALLADGDGIALSKWFATKGFSKFEEKRLAAAAYYEALKKKEQGFNAQLPPTVLALIQEAGGGFEREHTVARRALASGIDQAQLAASVFRAFGQLPLEITGYDPAMSAAEKIIELSDGQTLTRALALVEFDPTGLQGAAFLFCRILYHRRLPEGLVQAWSIKLVTLVLSSPQDGMKLDALRRLESLPGKEIDDFFLAIASGKTRFPYSAHLKRDQYDQEPELVSAACLTLAMRHHPDAAKLARNRIASESDQPSKMALEVALTLSTGAPALNPQAFDSMSYLIAEGAFQVLEEIPPERIPAHLIGAALDASLGTVRQSAQQLAFKLRVGPATKPVEQNYREIEFDKTLATENPTEAIAVYSGQLPIARGTTKAEVLRFRGTAYALLGQNEEALADFLAARELDYRRDETSRMIATALWKLGRGKEAIETISQIFPMSDPWNLEVRGLAHLSVNDFPKAEEDLSVAVLVDPRDIYRQFFQHIAACLSGHPEFSRLASTKGQATRDSDKDVNQWTRQVTDLLLGRITGEALLQAAQAETSTERSSHEAEACYYAAQVLRIASAHAREKDLLLRCISLKQYQLTEHWLAAARLTKFDLR